MAGLGHCERSTCYQSGPQPVTTPKLADHRHRVMFPGLVPRPGSRNIAIRGLQTNPPISLVLHSSYVFPSPYLSHALAERSRTPSIASVGGVYEESWSAPASSLVSTLRIAFAQCFVGKVGSSGLRNHNCTSSTPHEQCVFQLSPGFSGAWLAFLQTWKCQP